MKVEILKSTRRIDTVVGTCYSPILQVEQSKHLLSERMVKHLPGEQKVKPIS